MTESLGVNKGEFMGKSRIVPDKFYLAGLNLKAWRTATMKITQRELAKRLGMNSQFVSNWERGLCLPPKHAMPKILKQMHKSEAKVLREAIANDLVTYYWEGLK